MCDYQEEVRVRLLRCEHGTYHLSLGSTTVHVTEEVLSMIGRAINAMAERRIELWSRIHMGPALDGEASPGSSGLN